MVRVCFILGSIQNGGVGPRLNESLAMPQLCEGCCEHQVSHRLPGWFFPHLLGFICLSKSHFDEINCHSSSL